MGEEFRRKAFSRNIGILNESEQDLLSRARVAVLGMGGVGGVHLMTLVRLGIGAFHIADPDIFETPNFNRQYGASQSTVGRNKTEVMAELALDVNPDLTIKKFVNGITDEATADAFLEGVDLVVDGVDFFALNIRQLIFRKARERGIHVITAAPVGFGASMVIFSPTGMSFEDYYGLREGMSNIEMLIAFAVGLAPTGWHLRYMDISRIDIKNEKAPGLGSSCTLCAGFVATEAMKIILKRGEIKTAPYYSHLDAYLRRYKTGYLLFGGNNPLQKLKRWVVAQRLKHVAT